MNTAAARTLVGLAAALAAAALPAQGLYKVVTPDGRVTYTDRPPADAAAGKWSAVTPAPGGDGATGAALPAALRPVVQKYPVTLYTAANCDACEAARRLLTLRGVPFSERTLSSAADAQTLTQRLGASTVPSATVGRQALVGLNEAQWNSYLDAAGYPRTSLLPPGYKPEAPQPLTPPPPPPVAAAPLPAPSASEVPPALTPTRPGPGGIRF